MACIYRTEPWRRRHSNCCCWVKGWRLSMEAGKELMNDKRKNYKLLKHYHCSMWMQRKLYKSKQHGRRLKKGPLREYQWLLSELNAFDFKLHFLFAELWQISLIKSYLKVRGVKSASKVQFAWIFIVSALGLYIFWSVWSASSPQAI